MKISRNQSLQYLLLGIPLCALVITLMCSHSNRAQAMNAESLISAREALQQNALSSGLVIFECLAIAAIALTLSKDKSEKKVEAPVDAPDKYQDLIDNCLNGVAIHEMIFDEKGNAADYRFIQVNRAFEHHSGLKSADIIGHTVKEVLPATEDYWIEAAAKVVRTGVPIRMEKFSTALDGYFDVVLFRSEPNHFTTIAINSTIRRRANDVISGLETDPQTIFDTTDSALLLTDTKGRVLRLNPAFEKLFEYTRNEFIGKGYLDLTPQANLAAAKQRFAQLLKGIPTEKVEVNTLTKSGHPITFLLSQHPLYNEDGEITKLIMSATDITERKQTEERYQFLSNASHEAVLLCREGKIIEANKNFFTLTGRTEEEISDGLLLRDILSTHSLIENEVAKIDINNPNLTAPIAVEASIMHHEYQNSIIDVLILRDISEQKETEETLVLAKMRAEAASRAKSEFLTTMSHELRTPMNGVMGMGQLLQDTPLNPEQTEYVDTILESSRALLQIINDLLDLASIESGKAILDNQTFNLRETANFVIDILSPQARKKNLELAFNYDKNIPLEFIADEGRIRQILLNLLGNAVKFTNTGSVSINISAHAVSEEGTIIQIEIRDTGIGIPQDKLDIIFEKFTQVDQSDSRRFEGTGLGLNITKRLVELLKGSLSCESVINQGSTFTLLLPLTRFTPSNKGTHAQPDLLIEKQLNILLAEDKPTNRIVIEHLLVKMGCTITSANNGQEALELASENQYDLILMDIKMPVMNGFDATIAIRGAGIKTPIIAITAHATEGDKQTCLAAGMTDYLSKPIEQNALYKALQSISAG